MEELRRQVSRANRRLVFQQFMRVAPWIFFACLLVAVIGLAIPKIWVVPAVSTEQGAQIWLASWVGGALALAALVSIGWTFAVRRGWLEAAIEIDRRYGLKERVSSTLALNSEERETEIGKALVQD